MLEDYSDYFNYFREGVEIPRNWANTPPPFFFFFASELSWHPWVCHLADVLQGAYDEAQVPQERP